MAFQKLFTTNAAPSRLWTGKGTEFYNQQLKRVDRTMKNIMWKYFTANNTQKYIDVLPSMIEK